VKVTVALVFVLPELSVTVTLTAKGVPVADVGVQVSEAWLADAHPVGSPFQT
jgi:hypothetical protein